MTYHEITTKKGTKLTKLRFFSFSKLSSFNYIGGKACIGTIAVDVFNCDLNQSPWCVFGLKRKQPTKFLKCYPGPFAVSTGHLFSAEIQCT